jgi:hypothetical protein
MKTKSWILGFCLLVPVMLQAQDFEGLQDKNNVNVFLKRRMNIFIRYTSLGGKYTKTYDGFTANFSYRNEGAGKGEFSYNFENPVIGDLLWAILHGGVNNSNEQAFSAGFIGWHKFHWNVVAGNRILIAPGFSFGDYIFGSERIGVSPNVLEPNGYYLSAGPSLKANYVATKNIWFDCIVGTDFSFAKKDNTNANYQTVDGYPKPRFFQFTINAYHTSRFNGGLRYAQAIDKGDNKDKATRLDISFGYLFGNRD